MPFRSREQALRYYRAYYRKNRKHIKKRRRAYREAHREELAARRLAAYDPAAQSVLNKRYREKNLAKLREYDRKRSRTNRRRAQGRVSYSNNIEKRRADARRNGRVILQLARIALVLVPAGVLRRKRLLHPRSGATRAEKIARYRLLANVAKRMVPPEVLRKHGVGR